MLEKFFDVLEAINAHSEPASFADLKKRLDMNEELLIYLLRAGENMALIGRTFKGKKVVYHAASGFPSEIAMELIDFEDRVYE